MKLHFLWPSLAPQMLIRRRGGRSKGTVKRRLCLSMQCKYLHSSNEHLSSTRCDANLKLPLENICNFVAKKQKESKGEEREIRVSFTHLRFAIRFPPSPGVASIRNSSTLPSRPMSPPPLLVPPTRRLPARQAPTRQLTWAIECCSCALCHGELPLSNPPTPRTHTHRQTHSHVFSLRATAIVWQLLPSLPSLHCPLHNLSYELSACCPCQLRRLCCLIVTPARKAKIFRVRMPTLRILHV